MCGGIVTHTHQILASLTFKLEIHIEEEEKTMKTFTKYTYFVLIFNIAVILWGAYVRATGSGAGCGSHWPLCNGQVLPLNPQLETVIEFAHRITSALSIAFIVAMFIWGRRLYTKDHPVRLGLTLSLVFIIVESLLGASLVIFGWVVKDASLGRAIAMPIHLLNTFLLLGSLALTAWWAAGGGKLKLKDRGALLAGLLIALVGVAFIGMSGAIAALGDTLFPSTTISEAVSADFAPDSHIFIRLRVWHPVIAVAVGFYSVFLGGLLALFRPNLPVKRAAAALILLFIAQLAAGLLNVLLLAPVWLQLVHLLLADSVWVTLVLLSAHSLQSEPQTTPA